MCFIFTANPLAGYQAPVAQSVRASYLKAVEGRGFEPPAPPPPPGTEVFFFNLFIAIEMFPFKDEYGKQ